MNKKPKCLIAIYIIIIFIMLVGCENKNELGKSTFTETQPQSPVPSQISEMAETPTTSLPIEKEFDLETDEGQAMYAMAKLVVWDGSVANSFNGGDGSESNPYQIANGAQLAKLMRDSNDSVNYFSNKYFVLTEDILLNDLSKWDFTNLANNLDAEWNSKWKVWKGIDFNGQFDGAGHTVYGLYNCRDDESMRVSCGLFSELSNGKISNLNVACSIMNPCAVYVGTIAGRTDHTSIENCSVKQAFVSSCLHTINGTSYNYDNGSSIKWINLRSAIVGATESLRIGGICGYLYSGSTINGCSMYGTVQYTAIQNRNLEIGGISGFGSPSNCTNAAWIEVGTRVESTYISTSYPPTIYVGGICGKGNSEISNCTNFGDIKVDSEVAEELRLDNYAAPEVKAGGIVGSLGTSMSNCANSGQVTYEGNYKACISTVTGSIDTSDLFDYVLCRGGNYIFVAKETESVTEVVECVGILDSNYNWIMPLSNKTYINPYGKISGRWTNYSDFDDRCGGVSHVLKYAGDDIFVYGQEADGVYKSKWLGINPSDEWPGENGDPKIYHVLTDRWIDIDSDYESYDTIHFNDGYFVAANADSFSKWGDGEYVLIINSETGAQETSIYCRNCKYIGRYSEGLFFAYDGFYNINCEKVIDLSEYAGLIYNRPYFRNDSCVLYAKNENGSEYRGVIDSTGTFTTEFTKVSS